MNALESLFQKMNLFPLPAGLEERIFKRLVKESAARYRRALLFSSSAIVFSAAAFFAALFSFGKTLLHSEFWSLGSLLFSDLSSVMSYSGDFFSSLLETFPAVTLAAILLPIFALLVSFSWRLKLKEYGSRYHFA